MGSITDPPHLATIWDDAELEQMRPTAGLAVMQEYDPHVGRSKYNPTPGKAGVQ